jgi:hypothetical protein
VNRIRAMLNRRLDSHLKDEIRQLTDELADQAARSSNGTPYGEGEAVMCHATRRTLLRLIGDQP